MLLEGETKPTSFWDVLGGALAKIQIPGFGVPQVEPGTVIQTGPSGTLVTRQQAGYPVPVATGQIGVTGTASTGTGMMLIAGALAVVGVIWLMKRK
jgi:hypothetical protein